MKAAPRRALVAGVGVGGLAAALALARQGFDVDVFERAPALQELGAGLQLTPNATRALRGLGALEAISALAMAPKALRVLRGSDGGELAYLPIGEAERRWGAPYLTIHRADLQRALAQKAATAGANLHFGKRLIGLDNSAAAVTITLRGDGGFETRESGDLLIGADGLRSPTRALAGLGEADAPSFSGKVAFRATVAADRLAPRARAGEVTLRLGASAHLVHYPLRAGALVNLVAVIEATWREAPGRDANDIWDATGDRSALKRAFAGWSSDARALIGAAGEWRAWPLYARPPLPLFARGRAALVGDAAHPMTPFLAQGAAQAIEDAEALARKLSEEDDIGLALAGYSADRVARAARVQREALAQGRLFHLDGPLALARDLSMAALGPEGVLKRFGWLYAA